MEVKQEKSTRVSGAEEVVQGWSSKMSRKERNKMIREKAKARVAHKRLMSNNNNADTAFIALIHSVMNRGRRRPALPLTFSPHHAAIHCTTAHLPHYAYLAPAGYRVPNNGSANIVTVNTLSAPAVEQVLEPEPSEGNNTVEIGNGMLTVMQMVWTTGGNPNGKRRDGIMYNHMNQQGYIACCCHGQLFTPAEFVIHAGGTNLDHPAIHVHLSPLLS